MDAFNLGELNRLFAQSSQMEREVEDYEQSLFNEAKQTLIFEFNNHPVTKEIEAGPDAENISGTLGGRGNLYSFIGFPVNSAPTQIVRQIILEFLTIQKPSKRPTEKEIQYVFPIHVPINEIIEATPLPFEVGNSWVLGIEEGISGFSNFLYKVSKISRSGKGIETKRQILGGAFIPQPYLISMLSKFVDQLGSGNYVFE